jgi:hypothetical protein
MEVGHELAAAVQSIEYFYRNTETNYNRREAAADNLRAVQADFDVDRKSLDLLLQAQNRMTIADIAFFRSLVEYNKALNEMQMRQGTLLEYNNIHLAEREWVPDAKIDAKQRAWARRYAIDAAGFDPLRQEPEGFSGAGKPIPAILPPTAFPPPGDELTPSPETEQSRPGPGFPDVTSQSRKAVGAGEPEPAAAPADDYYEIRRPPE